MDIPWTTISKVLLDYTGSSKNFLEVVFGVWSIYWLFREIKSNWLDHRGRVESQLEKTLDIYGKLEVAVINLLRNKAGGEEEEKLLDILGGAYAYLSPDLYVEISKFIRHRKREFLPACLGVIQQEAEMYRIKYLNSTPVVNETLEDHFSFLSIVSQVFRPVGITFGFGLFLFVTYKLITVAEGAKNTVSGLGITLWYFSFILLVILILMFVLDKNFRKNAYIEHKVLLILLVISVVSIFIIHSWIFVITTFCLMIVTIFVIEILKKRRKKILPFGDFSLPKYSKNE